MRPGATRPTLGAGEKVAYTWRAMFMKPRQLGPTSRTPAARALSPSRAGAARGEQHHAFHARRDGVVERAVDQRRRHREDGQVHRLADGAQARKGRQLLDALGVRVDRVERAVEAEAALVVDRDAADLLRV